MRNEQIRETNSFTEGFIDMVKDGSADRIYIQVTVSCEEEKVKFKDCVRE